MVSKRTYRRVEVKSVDSESLKSRCVGKTRVFVGLDVSKKEIVACVKRCEEGYERPWSVENPGELDVLVEILSGLRSVVEVEVAMESTGTYGDAARFALSKAAIPVQRVSAKHVDDSSESFDGVPSKHDGKDAAIIADLASRKKCARWDYEAPSELDAQLRYYVKKIDKATKQQTRLIGMLEAEVTRHWPELIAELELARPTTLKILAKFGSRSEAGKDNLANQLRSWGRFKPDKIERIVESANNGKGLPMNGHETLWVKDLATEALQLHMQKSSIEKSIAEVLLKDEFWSKYVGAVGAGTLAVILVTVGDPRKYLNGGSFLKALGLNIKERSSGSRRGERAITKRGPALTRRWLYYWAMRAVQKPALKIWFDRFKGDNSCRKRGMKGLISMMRKLARSLRRCMHDELEFDYSKIVNTVQSARKRRRPKKNPEQSADE